MKRIFLSTTLAIITIQGMSYEKTKSSSAYTLPEEECVQYNGMVNAQVFFDSKRRFFANLWGNYTSKQKTANTEVDPLYVMEPACSKTRSLAK